MKHSLSLFKTFSLSLILTMAVTMLAYASKKKEFYEIKIYTIRSVEQEKTIDAYLKDAFIPAMHRQGIKNIGVFKPRETTEDFGKKIYVFTPLKPQSQVLDIKVP